MYRNSNKNTEMRIPCLSKNISFVTHRSTVPEKKGSNFSFIVLKAKPTQNPKGDYTETETKQIWIRELKHFLWWLVVDNIIINDLCVFKNNSWRWVNYRGNRLTSENKCLESINFYIVLCLLFVKNKNKTQIDHGDWRSHIYQWGILSSSLHKTS